MWGVGGCLTDVLQSQMASLRVWPLGRGLKYDRDPDMLENVHWGLLTVRGQLGITYMSITRRLVRFIY